MTEWSWEPDDFAAVWFSAANDRFPALLRYCSRFAYRDEFDTHHRKVRESYSRDEYEQIQLAVHTLTNCDMRLEILGGTARHRGRNGDQLAYRIIGAHTPTHAAVLLQQTQGERDGHIRVRLCRTENLPAAVFAAIPPRRPGKQQPVTVDSADLNSSRESLTGKAPHERYRRMLAGPIDGGGTAALIQGPLNNDPRPWNQLQWYDLPDGRYLELHSRHITLRPAIPQDFTTRFTTWIDQARQRLREDQPL